MRKSVLISVLVILVLSGMFGCNEMLFTDDSGSLEVEGEVIESDGNTNTVVINFYRAVVIPFDSEKTGISMMKVNLDITKRFFVPGDKTIKVGRKIRFSKTAVLLNEEKIKESVQRSVKKMNIQSAIGEVLRVY